MRLVSLALMLAAMPGMALPFTLINFFQVSEGRLPEASAYLATSRLFLVTQLGFIRTRLHQSIALVLSRFGAWLPSSRAVNAWLVRDCISCVWAHV